MTIEDQLKNFILSHYRSVRAFTTQFDIPYSTVDNIFKRGISGTGIQTILKVFGALNLDVESIESGTLKEKQDVHSKKIKKLDIPKDAEREIRDAAELLTSLNPDDFKVAMQMIRALVKNNDSDN